MKNNLAQRAIAAALASDWEDAIELNNEIIELNNHDIDALNRIAKAYHEIGDRDNALKFTQTALLIDSSNKIAKRCLDKYKIKKLDNNGGARVMVHTENVFIEEPGKTKIVSLINLGAEEILCKLDSGDRVKFVYGRHRITVSDYDDKYIGKLPDDVSSRILNLAKSGGEYEVFIKTSEKESVKVLIREVKCVSGSHEVSFPMERKV